jgi:hypothetical protein
MDGVDEPLKGFLIYKNTIFCFYLTSFCLLSLLQCYVSEFIDNPVVTSSEIVGGGGVLATFRKICCCMSESIGSRIGIICPDPDPTLS